MKSRKKIYDPIRHLWLKALPEEVVRQKLLAQMIHRGFPKSLLVVEASMEAFMPKVEAVKGRRVDILVLYSNDGNLTPLLLVECKASSFCNKSALRQLIGYNSIIGAPFTAFAGPECFMLFWQEETGLKTAYDLPTYEELTQACKEQL